jgi:hypothetical protein
LSLATYDVVLNALGHARFSEVWWASLTLRDATYAVLAGGALWTVLAKLGDLESYSGAELDRRESQLLGSLTSTRQLLVCAEDLARAVTPAEVAETLSADAATAADIRHAAVVLAHLGVPGQDVGDRFWVDVRRTSGVGCGLSKVPPSPGGSRVPR